MPTINKRWIVVEMRNGNIFNLLIDASVSRETCGEWLPYHKKLSTAEIKVPFHKERDLVTPKDLKGESKQILGPHMPNVEGMRIYDEDRAVKTQDIIDWSEATQYWNEACNKAFELDMKAWEAALKPGPRLVLARESVLDEIGKAAANGEVPRLRMPE